MLWLLFACADKAGTDSSESTSPTDSPVDSCAGAPPTATITFPVEGAVVVVGDELDLQGEVASFRNPATWAWLENGVEFWTDNNLTDTATPPATWTAPAPGTYTLTLRVTDVCDAVAEDSVDVTVVVPSVTITEFGPESGIPAASWHGLSVAPDGIVWGATSAGLVRFDPATETSTVYGAVDGLTTDAPTAVLAASDGTIWVGHVFDDTRQGEQIDPTTEPITILRAVDFVQTGEIQAIYRIQEQPYGVGVGDIWMGTNEGLCVYDTDLDVLDEHAHPTHPHDQSHGVTFTPEGFIWNADTYQISRWNYSNDGDLSPSADLLDYWPPWPVKLETPVAMTDAAYSSDGVTDTVWLTSSLYGVARVDIGADFLPVTTDLGAPFPATAAAVRAGLGRVWFGDAAGTHVWDGTEMRDVPGGPPNVEQLAVDNGTLSVWIGSPGMLTRVQGVP